MSGRTPKQASVTTSGPIEAPPRASSTLKDTAEIVDKLKDLKKLALGLLAFVPAHVNEYLLELGQGLLASLLVTIPLTIAVAVVVAGLFDDSGNSPFGYMLVALGALIVGNLLGASTGTAGLAEAWEAADWHPIKLFSGLITGYGVTYGYSAYIAPLVVGAPLGWAWQRLDD